MQQRFRGGNGLPFEGFADLKTRGLADDDVDNSPLFLVQPGVSIKKKENAFLESGMVDSTNPSMQASTEWLHRGPEGRVVSGCAWMCVRRKSFAEILQVLYRPTRHVAFSDTSGNSDFHSVELSNLLEAKEGLHSGARAGLLTFQSQSSKNSCACPSAVGSSLTRNSTSEIQLVGRLSSPSLHSVHRDFLSEMYGTARSYATCCYSTSVTEISDAATHFSGFGLSENGLEDDCSNLQSQFHPN